MKKDKHFFISECGKIIQHNKETETYTIRNNIKLKDKRISFDDFILLKTKKIGHQEYCRLMNMYFRDIKETWIFEGKEYQSLDNFERTNVSLSANYQVGKEIPFHDIGKIKRNVILVYHWGHVYYHDLSYNGYKQGYLYDTKTLKPVQWCQLKNCAPIFDKQRKKIV